MEGLWRRSHILALASQPGRRYTWQLALVVQHLIQKVLKTNSITGRRQPRAEATRTSRMQMRLMMKGMTMKGEKKGKKERKEKKEKTKDQKKKNSIYLSNPTSLTRASFLTWKRERDVSVSVVPSLT